MFNLVGVTVLLTTLLCFCETARGWQRYPSSQYYRDTDYPSNDESFEYVDTQEEGSFVSRFTRQNEGNERRALNRNINACSVVQNRIVGRWQCDNGQVIDCNDLCNGPRTCQDGSDETVLACRYVFCLDAAFRCSYGGCIRAEQECNGVPDCADGSDEETINCPGVLTRIRSNGNCSEGFFQCRSGECVFDDGVCSGAADCPDGSDETAEVCSTHFCPEPAFRCDYGACVPRTARCDGKQDCVDGSDERPEMCGNITTTMTGPTRQPPLPVVMPSMTPGGPTRPTTFPVGPVMFPSSQGNVLVQFRDFISRQEAQITQLRQENLQLRLLLLESAGLQIPGPQNNTSPASPSDRPTQSNPVTTSPRPGLIVPTAAIPPRLSEQNSTVLPVTMSTTQQPVTNTTLSTPLIAAGTREEGDCDAPQLTGGRVSDVFSQVYTNANVRNGQEIIFQCLAGTTLIGVNSTYCINGQLLHDLPQCTNQCSGLPLNTLSVQAECFNPTGTSIPCSPLLPPRTIAVLTCKVGYKRPDRVVPDAYTCMDDGNWNAHVFKCIPICGEVAEGRRLIVGGQESNITQVPWHAGIYENQEGRMQQICGGSIINPTAIVTAAHCFWDQQMKQVKDAQLYGVAVGKTLRDFDAEEPTAQKYRVATIRVYDQYMDYEGLYVSDIAVVLLDRPIIFQSYIKPICVEYNLKGNQRYVVSGIQGRVAGWGLTASAGDPSPILKTLDLPTVDFNTCLNESPASFKPFITTDKFCGGFTDGQSVCKGDSGGGLAFPKPAEDGTSTVYFLRGIVSVGPILQGSCDNTRYSAFTDIQLHNLFLYEFLFV